MLPPIIQEVGFDFRWDNQKVWNLDIPSEEIPLQLLTWHFDIPFLNWNGKPYTLYPRDVIANGKEFQEEYDRTMRADLSYPIDIMFNKERWLILDGLHRLMKAQILGLDNVSVRKISREFIPQIMKGSWN